MEGLKYIQVGGENGLSRVSVVIGAECRYLENALQIAGATIASKLLQSLLHIVPSPMIWLLL